MGAENFVYRTNVIVSSGLQLVKLSTACGGQGGRAPSSQLHSQNGDPQSAKYPYVSRVLQGGELRQPNLFGIAARGGRSAIEG